MRADAAPVGLHVVHVSLLGHQRNYEHSPGSLKATMVAPFPCRGAPMPAASIVPKRRFFILLDGVSGGSSTTSVVCPSTASAPCTSGPASQRSPWSPAWAGAAAEASAAYPLPLAASPPASSAPAPALATPPTLCAPVRSALHRSGEAARRNQRRERSRPRARGEPI